MAEQLVLDFGNTNLKAAIFSGSTLSRHTILRSADAGEILSFCENSPIRAAIIGAVIDYPAALAGALQKKFPVLVLDEQSRLPIGNRYTSPGTLGYDRLAAATGGWQLFAGSPVLAIVAGTCITYNLVDRNGSFAGGAISPGLHMRLRAMHEYTQKLPLVALDGPHPLVGDSTETSLRAGALHGAAAEVRGMMNDYAAAFPGLHTVIGGGDSTLLAEAVKNGIFARPNLVMEGLNGILSYHAENNLL